MTFPLPSLGRESAVGSADGPRTALSPESSKVVAVVESDSSIDKHGLGGHDWRLERVSEMRKAGPVDMDRRPTRPLDVLLAAAADAARFEVLPMRPLVLFRRETVLTGITGPSLTSRPGVAAGI